MKVYKWRNLFVICWVIFAMCTSFCSKPWTAQVNEIFCDYESDGISTQPKPTFFDIELGKSTSADLMLEHGELRHLGSYNVKGVNLLNYQYFFDDAGYVCFTVVEGVVSEIKFTSPGYVLYNDQQQLVYLSDIVSQYGSPEFVGYDLALGDSRIIAWPSQGVQVSVDARPEFLIDESSLLLDIKKALIAELTYFIPVTSESYLHCFYSRRFSEEPSQSDVIDIFPRDPFFWAN